MSADIDPSVAAALANWSPNFGTLDGTLKDWPQDKPLRIAVLGDFSASAAKGRVLAGDDLAGAVRPVAVEFDSIDTALARLAPSLDLPLGPQGSAIKISFTSLDDFHPDALFDRLDIFKALAGVRQRLLSPATFAAAAAELTQSSPPQAPTPAAPAESKTATAATTADSGLTLSSDAKLDDFARLLGRPAMLTPEPSGPIDELLRHVIAPHVQPAADPRRDDLVASVDASLSTLMRGVLHHPRFQALESLWRGLDFLLRRLETGADLRVSLLDVSALSFAADLAKSDDLARSGLHQLLVDQPAQQADGGYTYVLGCYQFDATPPHAELLGRMATIAQAAGATFISGIEAQDFAAAPGSANAPHPITARAWQALRALPCAAHLAVASPRFMLRYPYGKRSDPINRFAFEEFNEREGLRALLWGHPAWLLASVLAGPDAASGASLGADATVDDLPFHYALDAHGDQVPLPCTDRWVSTDTATRLAAQGLIAVIGHRGLPQVRVAPLQVLSGEPLAATEQRAPRSRAEVLTARSPRGGLAEVLETELNALLAARSAPPTLSSARDPGLDALISGQ